MIAANKFHVFLCLAVLSFTALSEENSIFTDHVNGIQAVSSFSPFNKNNDLDLCLLKWDKKISHEYCPIQYSFLKTNQKYSHHYAKSARAPPRV